MEGGRRQEGETEKKMSLTGLNSTAGGGGGGAGAGGGGGEVTLSHFWRVP